MLPASGSPLPKTYELVGIICSEQPFTRLDGSKDLAAGPGNDAQRRLLQRDVACSRTHRKVQRSNRRIDSDWVPKQLPFVACVMAEETCFPFGGRSSKERQRVSLQTTRSINFWINSIPATVLLI